MPAAARAAESVTVLSSGSTACLRRSLPNPTMPDPVGQPDCGSTGTLTCGCGPCFTGLGATDWTLSALQIAAASLTGPITWLLVGMTPLGTGRRGCLLR